MQKLTDLLNKINKIELTECEDFTLIGGDWKIKIDFDFDSCTTTKQPINVTLNVYYKNARAAFWGCDGATDIEIVRVWYLKKKSEIHRKDYEARSAQNALAEATFENL